MKLIKLKFIFFIGLFASCMQGENKELSNALNAAGDNRAELERVLAYYSKPADSLKLKAAKFLILNMPYHFGIYGDQTTKLSSAQRVIDTLSYRREGLSVEEKIKITDSVLTKIYNTSNVVADSNLYDSKVISSSFLINNIELAFKSWEKSPWKKNISFKDFCEYILPYRLKNEQLEYWRFGFYDRYYKMMMANKSKDLKATFKTMKWNTEVENNLSVKFNTHYPINQNLSDILKGRIGACESICFFAVSAMKSAGLPVSLDYIPHWGNANAKNHYVSHLVNHDKHALVLSNENKDVDTDTWGIVDFVSDFKLDRHRFDFTEMPRGVYIQNIKTIPKVYRHSYAADPTLKEINKSVPSEFIAPMFKKLTFKDVTDEYINSQSITLDIKPDYLKYKVVYLCVFNTQGWEPIAISEITDNYAIFDKLGSNVMYLPAIYDNGKLKPIDVPFWISSYNVIRKINKNGNVKRKAKLVRKFPLFSYTAYHTETLYGGKFEAADNKEFSNAVLLHEIKKYPFYMNEVNVKMQKPFRYLRYVPAPGTLAETSNIAEVQFFEGNDSTSVKGLVMGAEGIEKHEVDKAFDDNLDTYYENKVKNTGWVGLDLGPQNKRKISRIRFAPRSDTNCILPGNKYELYYWADKWVSLGLKIAKDYSLSYENIPENSLLWLKCKSGGLEERIFTLEDNTQIWW